MFEFFAEIGHKGGVERGRSRGLANRWFQPLTHVSARSFPRGAGTYGQRRMRETRNSQRFAAAHRAAQFVRLSIPASGVERV